MVNFYSFFSIVFFALLLGLTVLFALLRVVLFTNKSQKTGLKRINNAEKENAARYQPHVWYSLTFLFYGAFGCTVAFSTFLLLQWLTPFFTIILVVLSFSLLMAFISMLGSIIRRDSADRILRFFHPFLAFITKVIHPFITTMLQIIEKLFKAREFSSPFYGREEMSPAMGAFSILEQMTVEEVMIPRSKIEAIDFEQPISQLIHEIITSHHRYLLVYSDELTNVLGILDLRKTLWGLNEQSLTHDILSQLLTKPLYVPAQATALSQLYEIRRQHQAIALVVDEYGDMLGLLSQEDLISELLGDGATIDRDPLRWDQNGICSVNGTTSIREINQQLGITLPMDGPNTINGLLLEILEEIPDDDVSLKVNHHVIDIIQTQDRAITRVKIYRDLPTAP